MTGFLITSSIDSTRTLGRSGVRLSGPDAFSRTHTLRLDLDGRLAANDIKDGGYASVSLDGKRITANHLMP